MIHVIILMVKKHLSFLSLLIVMLPSVALANSENIELARNFSTKFTENILIILNDQTLSQAQKTEKLKPIIENSISQKVPALVLGAAYRQITPEQQQRFSKALLDFAEFSISTRLASLENINLQINDIQPVKRGFSVSITAQDANQEALDLSFRLICEEDNLRILDVSVAKISMILTQKAETNAIFSSQGIEGLIKTLEERNR